MRFIKNNLMLLILFTVELIFFIRGIVDHQMNFEVFFFGWGILWSIFFFYGLFGSGPSGALRGIGMSKNSDAINYSTLATSRAESEFNNNKNHKETKIIFSIQAFYGIMVVLNIIGYVVTIIVLY